MNLEKILENYGLNQKQAKIYLACLEMGSASVQKISQKAQISRSTAYEILEVLRNQGLISTFLKKKVKYYSVEDPQKAIDLLKEKSALMENAMPQLRAMYGKTKFRPTVRFYQGKEQMKMILEEMLSEAKEIMAFSSADDLFSTLDYFPEILKKRIKLKIPNRVILRDTQKGRERKKLGSKELRQVRLVPSTYDYHGMIMVWENKIAMYSFQKDMEALVIESEVLASTQKAMFEVIWDFLEK